MVRSNDSNLFLMFLLMDLRTALISNYSSYWPLYYSHFSTLNQEHLADQWFLYHLQHVADDLLLVDYKMVDKTACRLMCKKLLLQIQQQKVFLSVPSWRRESTANCVSLCKSHYAFKEYFALQVSSLQDKHKTTLNLFLVNLYCQR
mmetsp:Transcript_19090/g.24650  ORF Transcript_19090/g.24650 Transcript_19090/m.24650 type:complete len:146 (-) Transcript_19090:56-493(-)